MTTPLHLTIERSRVEPMIRALMTGKPVNVPSSGWDRNALIELMAATHTALIGMGPPGVTEKDAYGLHPAVLQHEMEQYQNMIFVSVSYVGPLVAALPAGHYETKYDPTVKGKASIDSQGSPQFEFVSGTRDLSPIHKHRPKPGTN